MGNYLKALEGIHYWDWLKLREAVDTIFHRQKREAERTLYLADTQELPRPTRQESECTED